MRDHFVLLMDRLLTESAIEAAIESGNWSQQATHSANEDRTAEFSTHRMERAIGSCPSKLVECRICHDEDEDSNMEIPCSCCGSLKYAHHKCVQRWCNEKGDTTCEICREQYKPGYTAPPPPLFHFGGNFRDLHYPQFITMVTGEREFLDPDFEEYYIPSGAGKYSFTLFMLLMLRTIGILLPICVMVKAFTAIQRRRNQQDSRFSHAASDEENELPPQQHAQPRFIHVGDQQ